MHKVCELRIALHFLSNGFARVDYSAVVPAAEMEPDGLVRSVGEESF